MKSFEELSPTHGLKKDAEPVKHQCPAAFREFLDN